MERKVAQLIARLDEFDPTALEDMAREAMFLIDFDGYAFAWASSPEDRPSSLERLELRRALVDLITRSEYHAGEVLEPLEALYDPSLVDLFRRSLRAQIACQHAGGMYTAMVGLKDIGEDIFADRRSIGANDWCENRELAMAYLARHPDQ